MQEIHANERLWENHCDPVFLHAELEWWKKCCKPSHSIWLSEIIFEREDMEQLWTEVAGLVQPISFFHGRAALMAARGCVVLNCTISSKSFCSSYSKPLLTVFEDVLLLKDIYLETMSALFYYSSQKHTGWPQCAPLIYRSTAADVCKMAWKFHFAFSH